MEGESSEHFDSPLHMLAEVSCFVRKKEKLLSEIRQREKSFTVIKRDSGVVNGAALNLLMLSYDSDDQRKKESPIDNVGSEVSDCKRKMKKKLVCDSEAENQEIKKERHDLNQLVMVSKINLAPESQTKIQVSGLKLRFYNVSPSCMSSSAEIVSKHGDMMGFHKIQITRKESSSGADLKGSHGGAGSSPPMEHRVELPLQFKTKIQELGGSEVKLVIEKQLRASDVSTSNSRFSIPKSQIQNEFLKEAEENLLDQYEENGQKLCGLDVLVLDPSLEQFNLQLKKWRMKENIIYNLTREWNKLRSSNGLREEEWVQLWSFRVHDQLCFTLVKL